MCYVFFYYILSLQLFSIALRSVMNMSFLAGSINEPAASTREILFGMLLQLS